MFIKEVLNNFIFAKVAVALICLSMTDLSLFNSHAGLKTDYSVKKQTFHTSVQKLWFVVL